MKPLQTVFSILSLYFLLVACQSQKECIRSEVSALPVVVPILPLMSDTPVLYQAGFSVLKYDFSGLIAFRRMHENDEIRIAFISEMGLKLMEFTFMNNEVRNTYCMPAIDKKARTKFVGKFLKLLLYQPECINLCQLDKLPNSGYFCISRQEKLNMNFDEQGNKDVQLTLGAKEEVRAVYTHENFLPDTIWVDMKLKTKIQMTKLNDAFN